MAPATGAASLQAAPLSRGRLPMPIPTSRAARSQSPPRRPAPARRRPSAVPRGGQGHGVNVFLRKRSYLEEVRMLLWRRIRALIDDGQSEATRCRASEHFGPDTFL